MLEAVIPEHWTVHRGQPGAVGNVLVIALLLVVFIAGVFVAAAIAATSPATATVEVAQAVELLRRELAAAERAVSEAAGHSAVVLRIEEAQLDLSLVELAGKGGPRLVVPGIEFGSIRSAEGSDNDAVKAAAKPLLRRHLSLDLTLPRPPRAPTAAVEPVAADRTVAAVPAQPGSGTLAKAVQDLTSGVDAGLGGDPSFDLKRLAFDLDFAVERDASGAPRLLMFAGDRRSEGRNVQKVRLKLVAIGKGRVEGSSAAQARAAVTAP